jgi:hypothetical protein
MGPVGHLAIGFAAKPAAPKAPLWVLLLATEVLDLLSFGFVTIRIEDVSYSFTDFIQGNIVLSVPWSHGLFMSVMWSALASVITFLIYRERRTASIIGLVVFSHWVLDFIVHSPDLPLLFDGSPMVGLGLWTSGPGLIISFILEFAFLAGGITIYLIAKKQATVQERVLKRGEKQ